MAKTGNNGSKSEQHVTPKVGYTALMLAAARLYPTRRQSEDTAKTVFGGEATVPIGHTRH